MLLILGLVLYSLFVGRAISAKYAPLVDACMEIKLEATTAHLWFEEIMSEDRYVDSREVWRHLDVGAK